MPGIAGIISRKEKNTTQKINSMAGSMTYGDFYHTDIVECAPYHACAALLEDEHCGTFETAHVVLAFYGEIFKVTGIEALGQMPITNAEHVYRYIDQYGFDVVKQFNGAFAIAYYEKNSRVLKLATDRMSMHRVYYWQEDDMFAYASECKALYCLDSFVAKPDYIGIGELLTNRFCSGERSFWEGVHILKPGSILTVVDSKITQETYWDGRYDRDEHLSDAACIENLYEATKSAVAMRTPDAELAMGLSGGCDARTILELLQTPGERIHSFTYGPSNSGDVVCAKQLAEVFGTDETFVTFSDDDLIKSAAEVVFRTDGIGEADLFFHIKMTDLKRQKAGYEVSSVPGDAISGKLNAETALLFKGNKTLTNPESKDALFRDLYKMCLAGKPSLSDQSIFKREYAENYKHLIEEDYIRACRERCTSDKMSGILFQHQLLTATTGRSIPVMAGVPATLLTVRIPFLDNDVLDCCGSMSTRMWRFQNAYLSMIEQKLPKAAMVPHYVTGTPISPKMNASFMYLKIKDYLLRKVKIRQQNTFLSDTYDFKRETIQRDKHGYVAGMIEKSHVLNDYLFEHITRDEIEALLKAAGEGDEKAYKKIQCRFNAAVLSEVFFEGNTIERKK